MDFDCSSFWSIFVITSRDHVNKLNERHFIYCSSVAIHTQASRKDLATKNKYNVGTCICTFKPFIMKQINLYTFLCESGMSTQLTKRSAKKTKQSRQNIVKFSYLFEWSFEFLRVLNFHPSMEGNSITVLQYYFTRVWQIWTDTHICAHAPGSVSL